MSKVNFILFVLILWLKYKNSIQTEIFIFKNFFLSVISLKFIAFIFFKKSQVSIINRICKNFPQFQYSKFWLHSIEFFIKNIHSEIEDD